MSPAPFSDSFLLLLQQRLFQLSLLPRSLVLLCFFTLFLGFKYHPYAAAAKSLQSCPTLCNPIDGSPPGSPVPGILQARTLEWVAISFFNAWKWKLTVKSLRVWLFSTHGLQPTRLLHPWCWGLPNLNLQPGSLLSFRHRCVNIIVYSISPLGWHLKTCPNQTSLFLQKTPVGH